MDNMNIVDQVSELTNSICAIKAVAASFAQRFVEATPEMNITAISTAPEDFNYNFYALFDMICTAREKILALEADLNRGDGNDDERKA